MAVCGGVWRAWSAVISQQTASTNVSTDKAWPTQLMYILTWPCGVTSHICEMSIFCQTNSSWILTLGVPDLSVGIYFENFSLRGACARIPKCLLFTNTINLFVPYFTNFMPTEVLQTSRSLTGSSVFGLYVFLSLFLAGCNSFTARNSCIHWLRPNTLTFCFKVYLKRRLTLNFSSDQIFI